MKKNIGLFLCVAFLAVSCNPFTKPVTAGMIKTINGGSDWELSNTIKDSTTQSLATINVSKIIMDPQNRETIFTSSYSGGLYKSVDSGKNWSSILSKIIVYDFVINPFDSKTIYAAGSVGVAGKILKTTDGGASWQEVYNEGSQDNPVRAIVLNPNAPNTILAGTSSGNIIQSYDGGISWRLTKNLDSRINQMFWLNGEVFVLTKTKGLFKTAEGKTDFSSITESLYSTNSSGAFYNYSDKKINSFNQVHLDSITPNLIYLTTNLGLYKTLDGGKNWVNLTLPTKTVENNRAVAVSKKSSNVVLTSVGSTIFKSTDGGISWQTQGIASSAWVQYILIDPELPQIAYAGLYTAQ